MCNKCHDVNHIAKRKTRGRTKSTNKSTKSKAKVAAPTIEDKLKTLPTIVGKHFGVPLLHKAYRTIIQGAYVTAKSRRIEEHALLYKGDIANLPKDAVPLLRINSACSTGDIFHDESCDCNWQFEEALRILEKQDGPGVVLYHFSHEGKGHGYYEKLKAYDGKMYPVKSDIRDFTHAVAILVDLGITRCRVMTNNPEKQQILKDYGIEIVEVVPVVSDDPAVAELYDYKARVWGHDLPQISEVEHLLPLPNLDKPVPAEVLAAEVDAAVPAVKQAEPL
jgi:GTP cyclohydrolase II